MPSFDVVSEVDQHEVSNAVDQANREVGTRFDFRGTDSVFELDAEQITLKTQSDFQLKQMMDMLESKLTKRGVDIGCLDVADAEVNLSEARQTAKIRQGLESVTAKKVVKQIKAEKFKVQASIQGEQIRVTGKKRDDLQAVISYLKGEDFDVPLQFTNFRD